MSAARYCLTDRIDTETVANAQALNLHGIWLTLSASGHLPRDRDFAARADSVGGDAFVVLVRAPSGTWGSPCREDTADRHTSQLLDALCDVCAAKESPLRCVVAASDEAAIHLQEQVLLPLQIDDGSIGIGVISAPLMDRKAINALQTTDPDGMVFTLEPQWEPDGTVSDFVLMAVADVDRTWLSPGHRRLGDVLGAPPDPSLVVALMSGTAAPITINLAGRTSGADASGRAVLKFQTIGCRTAMTARRLDEPTHLESDNRNAKGYGGDPIEGDFHQSLRMAKMAQWRFDPKGAISVSNEFYELLRLDAQHFPVSPRRVLRLLLQPSRAALLQAFRGIRNGTGPARLTVRATCGDGQPIALRVVAESDVVGSGASPTIFGLIRDITEETATVDRLQANREEIEQDQTRLMDFASIASDWFWETDSKHQFTFFSPNFEEFMGLSTADFLGRSRLEIAVVDEDRPLIERHIEDLKAHRPFRDLTYRLRRNDGSLSHIRASGKPVYDKDKTFIGYRGVGQDVTEERERALALERSTERMVRAQAFADFGSFDFDLETGSVSGSDRFCAILDLAAGSDDVTVSEIVRRVVPDDAAELEIAIRETVETGAPFNKVIRIHDRDGGIRHVALYGGPRHDSSGVAIGVFGLCQDITERLAGEAELRQQRYELEQAQRTAKLGFFRREIATGRLRWSRILYEIFERSEDLGEPGFEEAIAMIHPDDRDRVERHIADMSTIGERQVYEYRIVLPSGAVKDLWVDLQGERDASGAITHVLGIVQDISERRAQSRRVEQIITAIDNAGDAMGIIALDGTVSHINAVHRETYGYEPEELNSRGYSVLFEDQALFEEGNAAVRRGEKWEREVVSVTRSGERRIVYLRRAPVFDQDGSVTASTGVMTDITDWRKADERIRQNERSLREAQRLGRLAFYRFDFETRTISWSSEVFVMMGYDPETTGSRPQDILTLIEPEDRRRLEKLSRRAIRSGETVQTDIRARRGDGSWGDFTVVQECETDETGRAKSFFGTVQDITERKEAERTIQMRERELKEAQRIGKLASWRDVVGEDLREWSPEMYQLLGLDSEAFAPTSQSIRALMPEDDLARLVVAEQKARETGQPQHADVRVRRSDGSVGDFLVSTVCEFNTGGSVIAFHGTLQDISERKAAERLLARREQDLKEAQRLGRIGSWSYRFGDDVCQWSPELFELLRFDPESFTPTPAAVQALFPLDDRERIEEADAVALETGETYSLDLAMSRGDGTTAGVVLTNKCAFDANGGITGFVGTIQDVSERKDAERKLEQLAYYDPLTGLPNRTLFQHQLARALSRCLRNSEKAALVLLDLDHFKEINDSLGHAVGDALLRDVADRLRRCLSAKDFIARLGGDEFALLLGDVPGRDHVVSFANEIIAAIAKPVDLKEGEVFPGTSVGIVMMPTVSASAADVLRHADLALYRAKSRHRGGYLFFEESMDTEAQDRLAVTRDLRAAVEQGELEARFQPQVDLQTGRVIGFESLLRWQHPIRGVVSPSEFIPIAEGSGLIGQLGIWVLEESCRRAADWAASGRPRREISVNVSPAQLWRVDMIAETKRVLDETGLDPACLTLELTESVFADHAEDRVRELLTHFADMGLKLALDDFGTGYSSLGYLNALPFHKLKIDRVFVNGVETDGEKRALLKGIVGLGRGLGMTVVAEGAETEAQIAVLRDLGCDAVQGFVYAPALTEAELFDAVEDIEDRAFLGLPALPTPAAAPTPLPLRKHG